MSAARSIHGPEHALEQLQRLPGGPELLAAAKLRGDLALVGGAVRDLLLGHWPRELDVTVAGESAALAATLSASISPSERAYGHAVEPVLHERFGTASVVWDYGRIDIAEQRAERYPVPGALPEVSAGTVAEDLARRDFTVNALRIALGGPDHGRLTAAPKALEDLAAGLLRVLHEDSFSDDPTRMLRLARYQARLGFQIESRTAELAADALATGALSTVSSARIGAELRLALSEAGAVASLQALQQLGVLRAIDASLSFDEMLAHRGLSLLPADGRADLLLLATLLLGIARGGGSKPQAEIHGVIHELLDALEFSAGDRDTALAAAMSADALAHELEQAQAPSELHRMLSLHSAEAVALAGASATATATGAAAEQAARWLQTLRHVRLEIDGDDLLAVGVAQGPEIGSRLSAALALKLDGEIAPGRQAELAAALAARP